MKVKAPDIGFGLLAVGLAEAASNLMGDSLIDRAGRVVVAVTPLWAVERTVRLLGTADKPFLRANLIAGGAALAGLATRRLRTPGHQALLGLVGLAAAKAGRRHLDAIEDAVPDPFPLPVPEPLRPARDGAEEWPNVEEFCTAPGRFYVTDINLRPPAIELDRWRLRVAAGEMHEAFSIGELTSLGLQERDAILLCVHNRPGWDRLGQQRWTGLPLETVLEAAGVLPAHPDGTDVIMEAVDGYRQVAPLAELTARRAWVVVGMAGKPLPRSHGYPARVMTPGLVGQYNGVKWLHRLELVPSGSQQAWWVRRGWPQELIEVKPMARIDHPANTGMPPRLPTPPISVAAGTTDVVGTAWAPPHGVAAVELRRDGGEWIPTELAAEVNGDSWRRWRLQMELTPGPHLLEARCLSANGVVQAGEPVEPFPYGSGAYHAVRLVAA